MHRPIRKKSLAAGASLRTRLGELTTLSQTPKLDPRRLANVAFAPYDSPTALVPDCDAQIMVTLIKSCSRPITHRSVKKMAVGSSLGTDFTDS